MYHVEVWQGDRLVERQPLPRLTPGGSQDIHLRLCGRLEARPGLEKRINGYLVRVVPTAEDEARLNTSPVGVSQAPDVESIGVSQVPGVGPASSDEQMPEIEGYEVLGRLGQGGMSSVWRARQLSTGREVALKLMGGVLFGSDRSRARFEREVELFGQLTHPNIVRLYDSGLHRGVYYYAMELIEGLPLDAYARQHRLGDRAVVELMAKVADAVASAHQAGIIHRDIKPANVLVDADGEPHLLDFGLARLTALPDDQSALTQEGSAAGTIAYMPPEQAAGEQQRIGLTADVYSLGVVLYELLTGRLPHGPAEGGSVTLGQVINEPPRRPRETRADLDRDLEAILVKATARNPADRYATAGELAADLRRYQRGDTVSARRLTLWYLLTNRLRRHKWRVAAIAAVLMLLVGLGIGSYVQITLERDRAREAAEAAERSLYINRIALAREAIEEHRTADAQAVLADCPPRFRRWEWAYLQGLTDRSERTWSLPPGRPTGLEVRPDGAILAAIDGEGVYRLDPNQDAPKQTASLGPHRHAAFLADGRVAIARRGGEPELRLIDPGGSSPATALSDEPITTLVVGPDPRHLFAITTAGAMWRWSLETGDGQMIGRFPRFTANLSIAISGRFACQSGRQVLLGDLGPTSAKVTHSLDLAGNVTRLAWDSDGDRLAAGTLTGSIHLLNPAGRLLRTPAELPRAAVGQLAWSPDGTRLAFADRNHMIHVHNLETGRTATLAGHVRPIWRLAFIDDDRLISASEDGAVKRWRPDRASSRATATTNQPVRCLGEAPGSGYVFVGDGAGYIGRLAETDPQPQRYTRPTEAGIEALATSPSATDEARLIAVVNTSGSLHLWPEVQPEAGRRLHEPDSKFLDVLFSPNGRFLAVEIVTGIERSITVRRTDDLREVARWPHVGPHVWLDRDRALVADRSPDGTGGELRLYRLDRPSSGRRIATFAHTVWAMDADADRIAIALEDGTLLLGEVDGSVPVIRHRIQPFGVRRIRDVTLAEQASRVWLAGPEVVALDAESGAELLRLSAPEEDSQFLELLFSEPHQRVYAIDGRTLHFWSSRVRR